MPAPAFGAPASLPSPLLGLPLGYMTVKEWRDAGPSAPWALLIQNVHGHREAQRNVAAFIEASPGLGWVGLEGVAGGVDTAPFRTFPQDVRRELSAFFLDQGFLTGAEAAALRADRSFDLFGVEDPARYVANVAAFKAAVPRQKEISEKLSAWRRDVDALKAAVYSPSTLVWDRLASARREGKIELGPYAAALSDLAPDIPAPASVRAFLKARRLEASLDFAAADQERRSALEKLAERLSEADLRALLAATLDLRLQRIGVGEYHRRLETLCATAGVSLAGSPAFRTYLAYLVLADSLGAEFPRDVADYESRVSAALLRTPRERRLGAISADLDLLLSLAAFSFSPQDWTRYEARRAEIRRLSERWREFRPAAPATPDAAELEPFETFYAEAARRDGTLADNFLDQVRRRPSPVSAVITGGFHTAGLAESVRRRGMSYVVLSPKLTDVDVSAGSRYLDAFLAPKTPLEKLFTGERLTLEVVSSLAPIPGAGFDYKAPTLQGLWAEAGNAVHLFLHPDQTAEDAARLSTLLSAAPGELLRKRSYLVLPFRRPADGREVTYVVLDKELAGRIDRIPELRRALKGRRELTSGSGEALVIGIWSKRGRAEDLEEQLHDLAALGAATTRAWSFQGAVQGLRRRIGRYRHDVLRAFVPSIGTPSGSPSAGAFMSVALLAGLNKEDGTFRSYAPHGFALAVLLVAGWLAYRFLRWIVPKVQTAWRTSNTLGGRLAAMNPLRKYGSSIFHPLEYLREKLYSSNWGESLRSVWLLRHPFNQTYFDTDGEPGADQFSMDAQKEIARIRENMIKVLRVRWRISETEVEKLRSTPIRVMRMPRMPIWRAFRLWFLKEFIGWLEGRDVDAVHLLSYTGPDTADAAEEAVYIAPALLLGLTDSDRTHKLRSSLLLKKALLNEFQKMVGPLDITIETVGPEDWEAIRKHVIRIQESAFDPATQETPEVLHRIFTDPENLIQVAWKGGEVGGTLVGYVISGPLESYDTLRTGLDRDTHFGQSNTIYTLVLAVEQENRTRKTALWVRRVLQGTLNRFGWNIVVLQEGHAKKGVGKRLKAAQLDQARKMGNKFVSGDVKPGSPAARLIEHFPGVEWKHTITSSDGSGYEATYYVMPLQQQTEFVSSFGEEVLDSPSRLTVGHKGQVYVVDRGYSEFPEAIEEIAAGYGKPVRKVIPLRDGASPDLDGLLVTFEDESRLRVLLDEAGVSLDVTAFSEAGAGRLMDLGRRHFVPPGKALEADSSRTAYQLERGEKEELRDLLGSIAGGVKVSGRRVVRFDGKGNHLGDLTTVENSNSGVTVDQKGNVFVSDGGRLTAYDAEGKELPSLTMDFTSEGSVIRNVSIGPKGRLALILANYRQGHMTRVRVRVFDRAGEAWTSGPEFGDHGHGQGQFVDPKGLRFDQDGSIYVVDTGNHRIQKFSDKGNFVFAFGKMGKESGRFHFPRAITVDDQLKRLYVIDNGNHRVQVFDKKGRHLYEFGGEGVAAGKFFKPRGIAKGKGDSKGHIFVTDGGNGRVEKFREEVYFQGESAAPKLSQKAPPKETSPPAALANVAPPASSAVPAGSRASFRLFRILLHLIAGLPGLFLRARGLADSSEPLAVNPFGDRDIAASLPVSAAWLTVHQARHNWADPYYPYKNAFDGGRGPYWIAPDKDEQGRPFVWLDLGGSIAAEPFGYRLPAVARAELLGKFLLPTLNKLSHTTALPRYLVKFHKAVDRIAPAGLRKRMFGNGGAEVVEAALRAANYHRPGRFTDQDAAEVEESFNVIFDRLERLHGLGDGFLVTTTGKDLEKLEGLARGAKEAFDALRVSSKGADVRREAVRFKDLLFALADKAEEMALGDLWGERALQEVRDSAEAARAKSFKSFVIHFKGSYHGRTDAAASITESGGQSKGFSDRGWPAVDFPEMEPGLEGTVGESLLRQALAEKGGLDQLWSALDSGATHVSDDPAEVELLKREIKTLFSIRRHIESDPLAARAVILEPIQSEGGDKHASARFFRALRLLTRDFDAPLIIDEIQTGFGLTGRVWKHEAFGLVDRHGNPDHPDMVTAAKSLQVATLFYSDKYFVPERGLQGNTWQGVGTDMVRGEIFIEELLKPGALENVRKSGAYFHGRLKELEQEFPHLVSRVRGANTGLFLSFDLSDPSVKKQFLDRTFRNGLMLLGAGTQSIRVRGFRNLTTEHVDEAIRIMRKSLSEIRVEEKKKPAPVKPELVELTTLDPTIKLDVRYATANNILGRAVYGQARAFLARPAADALLRVHRALKAKGYGLLVYDGYRPVSVTKAFWDGADQNQRKFFADPAQGSKHNRGAAVDLALYDLKTGLPVEMPSGYDETSDRAALAYAGGSDASRENRDLLRAAMEAEGFAPVEGEWWHYDYAGWERYEALDVPFEDLPAPVQSAPARILPANPLERKLTDTTFVIFDTETTGFDPRVDRPIQIGAVKVRVKADGTAEVLDRFEQLIDPKMLISAEVTALTKITQEMVKGQPTLEQVLPRFMEFVGGPDTVLLAHNASYDTRILGHRMREADFPFPAHRVVDTEDFFKKVFPGRKSYKIGELIKTWKPDHVQSHTALSDTVDTAEVLQHGLRALADAQGRAAGELTLGEVTALTKTFAFEKLSKSRPMEVKDNFINGAKVKVKGKGTLTHAIPFTGEVNYLLSESGAEDVELAVGAAKSAQPGWAETPALRRSEVLRRAADILERRRERMARQLSVEMGKTMAESFGEIDRMIQVNRHFAEKYRHGVPSTRASDSTDALYRGTWREPVGVGLVISPWNLPLNITNWSVAEAMAAGDAVVIKPSEVTSRVVLMLADVYQKAGAPAGVVNVVIGGRETGQLLVDHPDVVNLSFTGSARAGKAIKERSGKIAYRRPPRLELGGNNFAILMPDADLAAATSKLMSGVFGMAGQRCTHTQRLILVEEDYDAKGSGKKDWPAFVAGLVEKASGLRVGGSLDPESQMGPVASQAQLETLEKQVERLLAASGARLLTGGRRLPRRGFFYAPTIIEVEAGSEAQRIAHAEEIFGPVLIIERAKDLAAAVELGNDTEYGLSAGIFTRSRAAADWAVERFDAGRQLVNEDTAFAAGPELIFGGLKSSSWGSPFATLGAEGVEEFWSDSYSVTEDRAAYRSAPVKDTPKLQSSPGIAAGDMDKLAGIPEHLDRFFIDGEWRRTKGARRVETKDPATGRTVFTYLESTPEEVEAAIASAVRAHAALNALSVSERAEILRRAAKRLDDADVKRKFAMVMTMESGKTLAESEGEVFGAARVFEAMAARGEAFMQPHRVPGGGAYREQYEIRKSVGVTGLITPWNFPLAIPAWTLGEAIITANAVVGKPAGQTLRSFALMADLLHEAGLPAGALNVVPGGRAVGGVMAASEDVPVFSFTGSGPVGKELKETSAKVRTRRWRLELGGNNFDIVLPDADLNKAAQDIFSATFMMCGQRCNHTQRAILVRRAPGAERDHDWSDLIAKLAEAAQGVKVGAGLSEGAQMGPLANESQLREFEDQVQRLLKEPGAELLAGGRRLTGPGYDGGYFYAPTLIRLKTPARDSLAQKEEVFGPLLVIYEVDDVHQALEFANGTPFGLLGAIHTGDEELAHWAVRRMKAGRRRINQDTASPAGPNVGFGGKSTTDSAMGSAHHTLGDDGLRFHTHTVSRIINTEPFLDKDLQNAAAEAVGLVHQAAGTLPGAEQALAALTSSPTGDENVLARMSELLSKDGGDLAAARADVLADLKAWFAEARTLRLRVSRGGETTEAQRESLARADLLAWEARTAARYAGLRAQGAAEAEIAATALAALLGEGSYAAVLEDARFFARLGLVPAAFAARELRGDMKDDSPLGAPYVAAYRALQKESAEPAPAAEEAPLSPALNAPGDLTPLPAGAFKDSLPGSHEVQQELFTHLAKGSFPYPFPFNVDLKGSRGSFLRAVDKAASGIAHAFLDLTSQIGSIPFGYNPPEEVKALEEGRFDSSVLNKVSHTEVVVDEYYPAFIAALGRLAPKGMTKYLPTEAGSGAVESALRAVNYHRPGRFTKADADAVREGLKQLTALTAVLTKNPLGFPQAKTAPFQEKLAKAGSDFAELWARAGPDAVPEKDPESIRKYFTDLRTHLLFIKNHARDLVLDIPDGLGAAEAAALRRTLKEIEAAAIAAHDTTRLSIKFIAFEASYHGRPGGAVSVTHSKLNREGFFHQEWPFVKLPAKRAHSQKGEILDDLLRRTVIEGGSLETLYRRVKRGELAADAPADERELLLAELRTLNQIDDIIREDPSQVAGVIVEPIQGEGGDAMATPRFFRALRLLTRRHGQALILDEVQAGFRITGPLYAHEHFNMVDEKGNPAGPDLVTTAKSQQVSVLYMSDRFFIPTTKVMGSTWRGAGVDMVRLLVMLDQILDPATRRHVEETGAYFMDRIEGLRAEFPALVSNVRGKGLHIAFDLLPEHLMVFVEEAFRQKLLMIPSGDRSIRIRGFRNLSKDEVDFAIERMRAALKALPPPAPPAAVAAKAAVEAAVSKTPLAPRPGLLAAPVRVFRAAGLLLSRAPYAHHELKALIEFLKMSFASAGTGGGTGFRAKVRSAVPALRKMATFVFREMPFLQEITVLEKFPKHQSYWLRDGNPFKDYPAAPLPKKVTRLIIGAGLSGVSHAHGFAEAVAAGLMPEGETVAVLDAKNVAEGSSGRNMGAICTAKFVYAPLIGVIAKDLAKRYPEMSAEDVQRRARATARAMISAMRAGAKRMGELAAEIKAKTSFDPHYSQEGMVDIAEDAEDLAGMAESVRLGHEDGFTTWKLLDPKGVSEFLGSTSENGGILYPESAVIDPVQFTCGLMALALMKGRRPSGEKSVELYPKTKVLKVEALPGGGYRVHTDRGVVEADTVIDVTEGYTATHEPALAPVLKAYHTQGFAATPGAPQLGHKAFSWGFFYGKQINQDTALMGTGYAPVKNPWVDFESPVIRFFAVNGFLKLFGTALRIKNAWGGYMGVTPDWMPLIGRLPLPGGSRWAVLGLGGYGNAIATLGAEQNVRDILGVPGERPYPAEFFSPERFAKEIAGTTEAVAKPTAAAAPESTGPPAASAFASARQWVRNLFATFSIYAKVLKDPEAGLALRETLRDLRKKAVGQSDVELVVTSPDDWDAMRADIMAVEKGAFEASKRSPEEKIRAVFRNPRAVNVVAKIRVNGRERIIGYVLSAPLEDFDVSQKTFLKRDENLGRGNSVYTETLALDLEWAPKGAGEKLKRAQLSAAQRKGYAWVTGIIEQGIAAHKLVAKVGAQWLFDDMDDYVGRAAQYYRIPTAPQELAEEAAALDAAVASHFAAEGRSFAAFRSSPLAKEVYAFLRRLDQAFPAFPIEHVDALSMVYTPIVGDVAKETVLSDEMHKRYVMPLAPENPRLILVSDSSAVLGFGKLFPRGVDAILDGKQKLLRSFGDLEAAVVSVDTADLWNAYKEEADAVRRDAVRDRIVAAIVDAVVEKRRGHPNTVVMMEDVAADGEVAFLVENALNAQGVPTIHDDQHATTVVFAAAILNGLRNAFRTEALTDHHLAQANVVIYGVGASGSNLASLLHTMGVGSIAAFDSKGLLYPGRPQMSPRLERVASFNKNQALIDHAKGRDIFAAKGPARNEIIWDELAVALKGANVYVGLAVPKAHYGKAERLLSGMAARSLVIAGENPDPSVDPDEVSALKKQGKLTNIANMAVGRFGTPLTTLNNSASFPGVFRGLSDAEEILRSRGQGLRLERIPETLDRIAALALSGMVPYGDVKNGALIPFNFAPEGGYNFDIAVEIASQVRASLTGEELNGLRTYYGAHFADFRRRQTEAFRALPSQIKQLLERLRFELPAKASPMASPAWLKTLEDMVSINSFTQNKAGVDAVGRQAAAKLEALGFRTQRFPRSTLGDHWLYRRDEAPGRPTVLLSIHIDTVYPPGKFEDFSFEDGKVFGPGVMDAKGGVVVILGAIEKLKDAGLLDKVNLRVVLNSDEENGSEDSKPVLEEAATGADYVFVFEHTKAGELVSSRRAAYKFASEIAGPDAALAAAEQMIELYGLENTPEGTAINLGVVRSEPGSAAGPQGPGHRFTATVAGKAAHAGNEYSAGIDANRALALKLRDAAAALQGTGATLSVTSFSGGTERVSVSDSAKLEFEVFGADKALIEKLIGVLREPSVPGAEAAVGVDAIDASSPPVGKVRVEAMLSYLKPEEERTVTAANEIVAKGSPRAAASTLTVLGFRPLFPKDDKAERFLSYVSRAAGRPVADGPRGAVSDANFFAAWGVPVLDGFGPLGGAAHTPGKEWALIESFDQRIGLVAGTIAEILRDYGKDPADKGPGDGPNGPLEGPQDGTPGVHAAVLKAGRAALANIAAADSAGEVRNAVSNATAWVRLKLGWDLPGDYVTEAGENEIKDWADALERGEDADPEIHAAQLRTALAVLEAQGVADLLALREASRRFDSVLQKRHADELDATAQKLDAALKRLAEQEGADREAVAALLDAAAPAIGPASGGNALISTENVASRIAPALQIALDITGPGGLTEQDRRLLPYATESEAVAMLGGLVRRNVLGQIGGVLRGTSDLDPKEASALLGALHGEEISAEGASSGAAAGTAGAWSVSAAAEKALLTLALLASAVTEGTGLSGLRSALNDAYEKARGAAATSGFLKTVLKDDAAPPAKGSVEVFHVGDVIRSPRAVPATRLAGLSLLRDRILRRAVERAAAEEDAAADAFVIEDSLGMSESDLREALFDVLARHHTAEGMADVAALRRYLDSAHFLAARSERISPDWVYGVLRERTHLKDFLMNVYTNNAAAWETQAWRKDLAWKLYLVVSEMEVVDVLKSLEESLKAIRQIAIQA